MKNIFKKETNGAALTVVGEQAVPEEVSEEKKVNAKKVGKIVVGAVAGAVALGAAIYKVATGKKADAGYTDLPGSGDAESAPVATESDFAEV